MMKLQKMLSLVVVTAMLAMLFAVPTTASAAAEGDTFTAGEFTYKVNADTATVTLTAIASSALSGDVTVPGTVSDGTNSYTVTRVGDAFKNQGAKTSGMTTLTLPDSITNFTGTATFYGCKFTSVHLPANLVKDGSTGYGNCLYNTFQWCSNLASVTLPASITAYYGTFRNSAVRTVTITGTSAVNFYGDSGTEGARAWSNGVSVTIYYPSNGTAPIRYTGSYYTGRIVQLGTETPAPTPTPTPSADVFEIGDFKYKVAAGTQNVSVTGFSASANKTGAKVLPETVTHDGVTYTVTSVGYAAFANTSGITSFVMPDTVTSVGTNVFYGCTSLSYVHLSEALANTSASRQLVGAFQYCSSLETVTIPAGITCLPKTFLNSGVKNIILKAKSTELPKGANNEYIPVSNPDTVKIFIPSDGGVTGGYKSYISHYYVYDGRIAFETKADNTLKIVSGLPGADYTLSGSVVLPESVGPLSVSEIGAEAFASEGAVTSFTVPDSVSVIGERAFADCQSLSAVTLSQNLSGTLNATFAGCQSLEAVTIPDGVTTLSGTFQGCTSLESVKFSPTVTALSNKAFYGCSALSDLAVPVTVTAITDGSNAAGSVFQAGITLYVQENSEALRYAQANNINYVVKPAVEYAVNGANAEVSKTYFRITGEYTIPASVNIGGADYTVTSIAANAFAGQDALTVLRVPDSLSSIGAGAFTGCNDADFAVRAKSGTAAFAAVKDANVPYIADDAASGLAYKKYPSEAGLQAYGAANDGALSGALSINGFDGMNVVSVGEGAFAGQTGITSVSMADTVTSIGRSAFAGCTALVEATLSQNVTGTLDSVFEGCTSLEGADIPSGVTALRNTYSGCASLTRVIIPANVTAIYENSFADCTGLETVVIPATVTVFDRIVSFKDESQTEAEYVETNTSKKWTDNPFKGATNPNLAICGVRGSVAEEFAYSSGIKFIDVSKESYPLTYNDMGEKTFRVSLRDIYGSGNATVIGALYDENGKMIEFHPVVARFQNGDTKTVFTHDLVFSKYAENTAIKLMAWTSLTNLTPLHEAISVGEPEPLKILVLGNSISLHGSSSSVGWFAPDGQGMAATSLDKDYAHIVLQKAKTVNPNVQMKIVSAWALEANFDRWESEIAASADYQQAIAFDADIIIAQFGENVKNNANEGSLGGNFDNENEFNATIFADIVKAFMKDGKNVPVIVVSSMMSNKAVVLNAKEQAAAANNWAYVNLCNDTNFSESKNSAYYLTPSQIEEGIQNGTFHEGVEIGSGVYVHPGNNGMRAIAYNIWRYMDPMIREMTVGN